MLRRLDGWMLKSRQGWRAEDGGPRADTLAIREFLIQKKDE